MRRAFSFPRGRHKAGTRIRLTKRQSKRMSCISSSPVWSSYLSILFLLWLQLSISHFALQCFHGSIKNICLPFVMLHCCWCNIVTNITGVTVPLGMYVRPFNKQCYVIRESRGWRRNREDEEEDVKFRTVFSLTDRSWKHKVNFMFCLDSRHLYSPDLISLLLRKPKLYSPPLIIQAKLNVASWANKVK